MKYIVVWSKENGERKHFGTATVPDKFYILMDSERTHKDGMQILVQYNFNEMTNELTVLNDSFAIIKMPLQDIEYEILGPIQFKKKYPKDEEGKHQYV